MPTRGERTWGDSLSEITEKGDHMFEIAAIDHIVLRTTKLQDMLRFYSEMLGCKIERETSPEFGLIQLRAGNALIDLVVVDSRLGRSGGGPPTPTENNLDHFCLQLEPISEDEIRSHLESHGIEAGDFEDRYGAQGLGRSIYIKDPEGNVVELRSRI
jgi:catechol 2,3-dioxygenase-like lactoylglutathione lyase family enzyme